jgi:hypothetical protein
MMTLPSGRMTFTSKTAENRANANKTGIKRNLSCKRMTINLDVYYSKPPRFSDRWKEFPMGLILLIIVILLLVGAMPTWGYSRNWGYAPTGGLGLVLLMLVVLLLLGYLPRGF